MTVNYSRRLAELRSILAAQGLEALLVMQPENRRYISGFTGEGALIVTSDTACLFTDGRFVEQAHAEAPDWDLKLVRKTFLEALTEVYGGRHIELGFEENYLTYRQFRQIQEQLPQIRLRPVSGLVEKMRMVKDAEEIAMIREAGIITCAAFRHLLGELREGMTEQEAAGVMEFFMRSQGAGLPAFDTIVASGQRSALPHGSASEKRIGLGELIVLDLGATYRGYAADLTRTVALGHYNAKQREVYEVVKDAQQNALDLIRAGITTGEADAAARRVIEKAGYGEYFSHSLGHGVGLAVHEEPRLAPGGELVLEAGMVVTVEPGVYLPGWGGVRIEDTVLVTDKGCEILTPLKKELIVV
ncbi:MAG TPA: aminopeptidase P family protein [Syntrophomonadaceae bacterium]|nr:aminopeptidase P family protein [Syntrophomonadaceae bacterium]